MRNLSILSLFLSIDDTLSLQKKWKQLRDRYVKRYEREDSPMESEFQPLWSRMKWLDRHILPHHERGSFERKINI